MWLVEYGVRRKWERVVIVGMGWYRQGEGVGCTWGGGMTGGLSGGRVTRR